MILPLFVFFFNLLFVHTFVIRKEDLIPHWVEHKSRYSLEFDTDEEVRRFEIFHQNHIYIRNRNQENRGFHLAMNELGHLEPHEAPRCLMNRKDLAMQKAKNPPATNEIPLPGMVDWRLNGVVSQVKDQKKCGSCYSFSAVGAVEAHYAKLFGQSVDFSEQEIVDCSGGYGNKGCNGGLMSNVFKYIEENGLTTEDSYPYTAKEGECNREQNSTGFRLKTFIEIPQSNEHLLQRALAFVGPVAIAVYAGHKDFMFYKGGILNVTECSSDPEYLDHGVLAVGYSIIPRPHVIVKNSWGTRWGEDGYIRIPLFQDNACGIASMASYPVPDY